MITRVEQLPGLELDEGGLPRTPLVFVDLERAVASLAPVLARAPVVTVGVTSGPIRESAVCEAVTLSLTEHEPSSTAEIRVADLVSARHEIAAAVHHAPRAAITLDGLLRITSSIPVDDGLVAESAAYSMLLAGDEFARWRRERAVRPDPGPSGPAVLLERTDGALRVTLNRAERHNAFGRHVRDGLVEAFDLALSDPTITDIEVRGTGRSFCSGGDLDEFGSSADVTTAHLIRLDRSVAVRVHRCRERTTVYLHGACIGAGIEIPSYAGHVVAAPNTSIALPEIAMGLVPGAGGTVGITRRIGRWRTAWLALTGRTIGPDQALDWGLVDAIGE